MSGNVVHPYESDAVRVEWDRPGRLSLKVYDHQLEQWTGLGKSFESTQAGLSKALTLALYVEKQLAEV